MPVFTIEYLHQVGTSIFSAAGASEEAAGVWSRLSRPQSEALLEELFAHGLTPPNVLCVEYEPGTTVIWDNRLVLHRGQWQWAGTRPFTSAILD